MVKVTGAKLDFEDISLKDGAIDRVSVRATFSNKGVIRERKEGSVKIDKKLLTEIENFIGLEKNRFRCLNKRQFVDMAVSEFLRAEKVSG